MKNGIDPVPCSGAEGSPLGAFEHPMDRPESGPGRFIAPKGEKAPDAGVRGASPIGPQRNSQDRSKKFA